MATGRGCDTATRHLLLCKLFIAYILAVSLTLTLPLPLSFLCFVLCYLTSFHSTASGFYGTLALLCCKYANAIRTIHPTILPTPTLCSRRGVAVPGQTRPGQSQINLYEKCHVSLLPFSSLHAALAVKIFMHLAVRHV